MNRLSRFLILSTALLMAGTAFGESYIFRRPVEIGVVNKAPSSGDEVGDPGETDSPDDISVGWTWMPQTNVGGSRDGFGVGISVSGGKAPYQISFEGTPPAPASGIATYYRLENFGTVDFPTFSSTYRTFTVNGQSCGPIGEGLMCFFEDTFKGCEAGGCSFSSRGTQFRVDLPSHIRESSGCSAHMASGGTPLAQTLGSMDPQPTSTGGRGFRVFAYELRGENGLPCGDFDPDTILGMVFFSDVRAAFGTYPITFKVTDADGNTGSTAVSFDINTNCDTKPVTYTSNTTFNARGCSSFLVRAWGAGADGSGANGGGGGAYAEGIVPVTPGKIYSVQGGWDGFRKTASQFVGDGNQKVVANMGSGRNGGSAIGNIVAYKGGNGAQGSGSVAGGGGGGAGPGGPGKDGSSSGAGGNGGDGSVGRGGAGAKSKGVNGGNGGTPGGGGGGFIRDISSINGAPGYGGAGKVILIGQE